MYFIAPLQENVAITLSLARSLGHVRAAELQVQIKIRKALLRLYITSPGHHVHGLVLDLPARRLTVAGSPVVQVVAIEERDRVGRRSGSERVHRLSLCVG